MGKASRTKGHGFEREAARDMQLVYPTAKRGIGQSRGGGAELPDVDGTPFHIECKRGVKVNVRAALRQAQRDSQGRPVLVLVKEDRIGTVADRIPTFAVMPWDELLVLLVRAECGLPAPAARAAVAQMRATRARTPDDAGGVVVE